jgi:hypothetical protein
VVEDVEVAIPQALNVARSLDIAMLVSS